MPDESKIRGRYEMAAEMRERRKKMLKFHFRGISAMKWVAELAQSYKVSEIAIWQDWRRRKTWISDVFELNDIADDLNMNMAELANVKEEAWRTYQEATTAQAKALALKIILGAIRDKIEILQSLGEVHKEPQKIEIEGRVAIAELLKVYNVVAEGIVAKHFSKDNFGK